MEMFFGLLLMASMAINGVFIWYIKKVIARSSLVYNATTDMLFSLQDFVTHLDSINELRAFYGDQDFKNVMDHAKQITEDISSYRSGFIFEFRGGTFERTNAEETTKEE